jgi:hypothetical protein
MALLSFTMVGRAADLPGISPETVTDYIPAVIEADRTFYTIHVVERMQKQGESPAAESWRVEKKTFPLPVQFRAEASDVASKTGTKVRYRLISLWPINPHNAPDGEPEKNRKKLCKSVQNGLPPVRSRSATRPISRSSMRTAPSANPALAVTTPIRPALRKNLSWIVMGGLVIEILLGK